jgi:hypothetical protein
VSAAEVSPLNRLFNLAPLARLRQVVYAAAARPHLVHFDRLRSDRAQVRTLLGLVHRGRATPFGQEHDFERIRCAEDFRRLVPLRTAAELAREYPKLGQTWPAAAPFAHDFLRARRHALHTALSLVLAARPRANLLQGRLLCLDTSADDFPALVRPSVTVDVSLRETKEPHAEREAYDLTCLVGPASRVAAFLEGSKPTSGAVLYCRDDGFSLEALRRLAGPRALLVEMLQRPGATLAVEDPRHGGLRLLPEHGAYFEFVPADQAAAPHPPRLSLGQVRAGVPYEVAISSCAGWWACRCELVVAFDRLAPPTLRVIQRPVSPAPVEKPAHLTIRPPHPRSAGSPAGHPETFVRSPWSVPVDRG